jgi:hypothetical protein
MHHQGEKVQYALNPYNGQGKLSVFARKLLDRSKNELGISLEDAKVIERTDLDDASQIEDIILELYEQGVDAVWIGGGEEELVVVNPYSILFYKKGGEHFEVYGGLKSQQLTDEQIKNIYDESKILWEKYSNEYKSKTNKEEREEFLRSIKPIKFQEGNRIN